MHLDVLSHFDSQPEEVARRPVKTSHKFGTLATEPRFTARLLSWFIPLLGEAKIIIHTFIERSVVIMETLKHPKEKNASDTDGIAAYKMHDRQVRLSKWHSRLEREKTRHRE
jgi:hypothetical protein